MFYFTHQITDKKEVLSIETVFNSIKDGTLYLEDFIKWVYTNREDQHDEGCEQ